MPRTHLATGFAAVGFCVVTCCAAFGQDYPSKPVRIITGPAGGGSDFTARQIAQAISPLLGQPVVVDNRASAQVADAGSKVPADGYTLMVQGATVWITPLLQKVTYDAERDFAPITLIARDIFVLVTHPSLPVRTVKELVALAKTRPGELNYSSSTAGGAPHLGMELLKSMAAIDIVAIRYRDPVQAYNAVMSGETGVTVANMALAVPNAKVGKVKALAVTSLLPTALAPGLPSVAGSGLPGYELVGATGMWAPAKTPTAIVARLNQEVIRYLNRPETRERFAAAQQEIVANSPEQFAATIKADVAKWSKLFKETGIKAE